MKAFAIVQEEAKKQGIEAAELVLKQALELVEAVAPRLAIEAEEPAAKVIGSGLTMILPAVKPALEKLIDLNKDNKIGG